MLGERRDLWPLQRRTAAPRACLRETVDLRLRLPARDSSHITCVPGVYRQFEQREWHSRCERRTSLRVSRREGLDWTSDGGDSSAETSLSVTGKAPRPDCAQMSDPSAQRAAVTGAPVAIREDVRRASMLPVACRCRSPIAYGSVALRSRGDSVADTDSATHGCPLRSSADHGSIAKSGSLTTVVSLGRLGSPFFMQNAFVCGYLWLLREPESGREGSVPE